MTFGIARDLSSQVVAVPMTSFGMLMNSPDSEFQRISPQNARGSSHFPITSMKIIPLCQGEDGHSTIVLLGAILLTPGIGAQDSITMHGKDSTGLSGPCNRGPKDV